MKKVGTLLSVFVSLVFTSVTHAQQSETMPLIQPLFEHALRDPSICVGPDGTYYLTGTTANNPAGSSDTTGWWYVNEGIRIWKSQDLKKWEPMGLVWDVDKDATWAKRVELKNGIRRRAVWAPEISYMKGTFWLTYSMNYGGCGLLRSTTGKAEGPYTDVKTDGPVTGDIDASLFQDDDGKVYFLHQNGLIARMNDKMTGLAEEPHLLKPANHEDVGFEGTFLTKYQGKYVLICAEFNNRNGNSTYDCMAAVADKLNGPYSDRYLAIPHGGHNMIFKTREGKWMSTFFGSDPVAAIREKPGLLPISFSNDGHFRPLMATAATFLTAKSDPVTGQVLISDQGKPVLQYNYKTVYERDALDTLPANKYFKAATDTFMANPSIYAVARSNYIHPVYGPEGEMLTRDWSKDHPHHRGVYWAWPEVEYGKTLGDLHALQIVFARPTGKIALLSGSEYAQIEAENLWLWGDSTPIVNEDAMIRVYPATKEGRMVDLAFRFVALKDSVTLARRGTNAYGGLNVRMQTPKSQKITTHRDSTDILPRRVWSDLSGLFSGARNPSGMMVFQSTDNPEYPGDWVQYPDLAWVQPTFPTSGTRYKLERGKPLVLRFRVFIHSGTLPSDNLASDIWDSFNAKGADQPMFTFPLTK